MIIHSLDDRPFDHTGVELVEAGSRAGFEARLFKTWQQAGGPGYVFMRLCQNQPRLDFDRSQYYALAQRDDLKFIQDVKQIKAYENKGYQADNWSQFMPRTRICYIRGHALLAIDDFEFPIVSKSFIGSASHNVRILKDAAAAAREIDMVFGPEGMAITGGRQQGYTLWQEFIPHDTTYRVTAVGRARHVYQRFNYPDRPVAAPAKVVATQPASMSPKIESLLEFSNRFFKEAKTQWCAIDVLQTPEGGWRLLETALGWARGNDASGNAPFYGTKYSLNTQHELLVEEIRAGVFG